MVVCTTTHLEQVAVRPAQHYSQHLLYYIIIIVVVYDITTVVECEAVNLH